MLRLATANAVTVIKAYASLLSLFVFKLISLLGKAAVQYTCIQPGTLGTYLLVLR